MTAYYGLNPLLDDEEEVDDATIAGNPVGD